MKNFLHRNGLSCFLLAIFLATYGGGQVLTGWHVYNEERADDGAAAVSLTAYLRSAHLAEATAENWESEFLQMFLYVFVTAFLVQKGSAESNDPDEPEPARPVTARSPWPVRRGGWWRRIYAHSLSLAFALLFFVSLVLHAWGSWRLENEERLRAGRPPQTLAGHVTGARFWFESFQNWQSEFLAIASMVLLSIWLRERGSPESKALEAPDDETGA